MTTYALLEMKVTYNPDGSVFTIKLDVQEVNTYEGQYLNLIRHSKKWKAREDELLAIQQLDQQALVASSEVLEHWDLSEVHVQAESGQRSA